MNEVYQKVGVKKKGKATDLEKLYGFKIHPCKICLMMVAGKMDIKL